MSGLECFRPLYWSQESCRTFKSVNTAKQSWVDISNDFFYASYYQFLQWNEFKFNSFANDLKQEMLHQNSHGYGHEFIW